MMLMGLGPFRFHVPTIAYQELSRRLEVRVPSQPVIGARPPNHFLGPGEESRTIDATFFPHQMNPGGRPMQEALFLAAEEGASMMMVSGEGRVFGRWIIRSIGNYESLFLPNGAPQQISVYIDILRDDPLGGRFRVF